MQLHCKQYMRVKQILYMQHFANKQGTHTMLNALTAHTSHIYDENSFTTTHMYTLYSAYAISFLVSNECNFFIYVYIDTIINAMVFQLCALQCCRAAPINGLQTSACTTHNKCAVFSFAFELRGTRARFIRTIYVCIWNDKIAYTYQVHCGVVFLFRVSSFCMHARLLH